MEAAAAAEKKICTEICRYDYFFILSHLHLIKITHSDLRLKTRTLTANMLISKDALIPDEKKI